MIWFTEIGDKSGDGCLDGLGCKRFTHQPRWAFCANSARLSPAQLSQIGVDIWVCFFVLIVIMLMHVLLLWCEALLLAGMQMQRGEVIAELLLLLICHWAVTRLLSSLSILMAPFWAFRMSIGHGVSECWIGVGEHCHFVYRMFRPDASARPLWESVC